MKFGGKYYYKPTPKRLRKLGDTLLLIVLFVSPYQIIMEDHRLAILVIIIGIIGKILTNTFTEDNKEHNQ